MSRDGPTPSQVHESGNAFGKQAKNNVLPVPAPMAMAVPGISHHTPLRWCKSISESCPTGPALAWAKSAPPHELRRLALMVRQG